MIELTKVERINEGNLLSFDVDNGDIRLRTVKNILQHELIGMDVKILDCPVVEKANTRGTIIDETRNMLTIETKSGVKNLPKESCTFSFKLRSGERVRVEGRLLVSRPEDRIKKKLRKW